MSSDSMIRRKATTISLTMADVLALDDEPRQQQPSTTTTTTTTSDLSDTPSLHFSPQFQTPVQYQHHQQQLLHQQQQQQAASSPSPKRGAASDLSESSSSPFSTTAFPASSAAGVSQARHGSVQRSSRPVANHN